MPLKESENPPCDGFEFEAESSAVKVGFTELVVSPVVIACILSLSAEVSALSE